MNIQSLKKKLLENKGKIMGVIAYAGDSKTMTVENLTQVAETVKEVDETIWLHADACHGFSLGFSEKLRKKLKGLELFDSTSADPHKVLNVPFPLSALLVKHPQQMQLLASTPRSGDRQESLSFGRITPFFASRSWMSLKFWFLLKSVGIDALGEIIDRRYELAQFLAEQIGQDSEFILLNQVDINAVMFFYRGSLNHSDVNTLNRISAGIEQQLKHENLYHLHRSSLEDPGIFRKGAILKPLRYMSGNPRTTQNDLLMMLEAVRRIGRKYLAIKTPEEIE